jgi:hypothetical protein
MQKTALVIGIVCIALATPAFAIAPMTPKYCAQLRGGGGAKPDCTFKTLQECRASLKGKGGGHCYRMHG